MVDEFGSSHSYTRFIFFSLARICVYYNIQTRTHTIPTPAQQIDSSTNYTTIHIQHSIFEQFNQCEPFFFIFVVLFEIANRIKKIILIWLVYTLHIRLKLIYQFKFSFLHNLKIFQENNKFFFVVRPNIYKSMEFFFWQKKFFFYRIYLLFRPLFYFFIYMCIKVFFFLLLCDYNLIYILV